MKVLKESGRRFIIQTCVVTNMKDYTKRSAIWFGQALFIGFLGWFCIDAILVPPITDHKQMFALFLVVGTSFCIVFMLFRQLHFYVKYDALPNYDQGT